MLLSEEETRSICEKLLDRVKADDAQVRVRSEDSSHMRFAANTVTTSGRSENATVRVTVWIDTKRGESSTNELDEGSLQHVVEEAEQIARVAPADREYLPTLGPQSYQPVNGYVEATSELSLPARARSIGEVIAACEKAKLIGAGFHEARGSARATATKNGNFHYQRQSRIELSVTARTPDGSGSGYFSRSHFDIAKLDTARIAREAIQKALNSRNPRPLEPGVYPVILEPQAVSDLLSRFRSRFDARSAEEGRSPFSAAGGKTKLGEQIFDERINLYSDPWDSEVPGSEAAQDGIPAQKLFLIRQGVVENLIYSRFWAQQKETEPTPGPVNSILESSTEPTGLPEMIRVADRALLVSRFWYIRSVNPQTAASTGLTRDGVWLIEKGEIAYPVQNFRFNQSLLEMLSPGNIERIGRPERINNSRMPPLMLREFHFTSQSEAV